MTFDWTLVFEGSALVSPCRTGGCGEEVILLVKNLVDLPVASTPRSVVEERSFAGGSDHRKGFQIEKSLASGDGGVGEGDAFDGGFGAILTFVPIREALEKGGSVVGSAIPIEFCFFPTIFSGGLHGVGDGGRLGPILHELGARNSKTPKGFHERSSFSKGIDGDVAELDG